MKCFSSILCGLLLCACGQALALAAEHPANPDAAVPAFQPADYFVQPPVLAAAAHQHDQGTVPTPVEGSGSPGEHALHHSDQPTVDSGATAMDQGEGKSCKRSGDCCCCCKCCDKGKGEPSGKEGCGMAMKEDKLKSSPMPAVKKGEEHESHH